MASKAEVGTVLRVLVDAYPSMPIGPQTLRLYVDELADLDAELLARAARACVRTSRFFPTIAEIRERAEELRPKRPLLPVWRDPVMDEIDEETRRENLARVRQLTAGIGRPVPNARASDQDAEEPADELAAMRRRIYGRRERA
jgi:hypothetical protein